MKSETAAHTASQRCHTCWQASGQLVDAAAYAAADGTYP